MYDNFLRKRLYRIDIIRQREVEKVKSAKPTANNYMVYSTLA